MPVSVCIVQGGDDMEIEYKYLWAWDRMMGSCYGWSECKQLEAKEDNAPEDAIYKDTYGNWRRFRDIKSDDTKKTVQRIVDQMK